MKDWPDKSIGLVLTDPPYNGGLDYGDTTDDSRPFDIYIEWLNNVILECERVCRGPVLVFLSKPGMMGMIARRRPWWIGVWVGGGANPAGPNNGLMFSPSYEPCLFYGNRYGIKACISDVWNSPAERSNYNHPCPKPLRLMKKIIDLLTADLILDPFCGSGTTCVAAKLIGRRFIGIDISPEYCKIAEMRLKAVETGVSVAEQKQGMKGLFENDQRV